MMRWALVGTLGSWGLWTGLLAAFVGLRPWQAALAWGLGAALQVAVVLWRRAPPFETVLAASVTAGVLQGAVLAGLVARVVALDPTAAQPSGLRAALLAQGLVTGFLVGIVAGGVAVGIDRVRSSRPIPSPPRAAK